MTEQEKVSARKIIQDNLRVSMGRSNKPYYSLWKACEHAVQSRVAYEILKEYDYDPQGTVEKYDIQRSKTYRGGIFVDLAKVPDTIWIPEELKKVIWKDSFEIFDQDQFNAFFIEECLDNVELMLLVNNVLYCRNRDRVVYGEKFNLFLKNPEWRQDAKKYSIVLLEVMRDIKYIYRLSEDPIESIDLMISMFLEEMN
jgi:hypothetical protein